MYKEERAPTNDSKITPRPTAPTIIARLILAGGAGAGEGEGAGEGGGGIATLPVLSEPTWLTGIVSRSMSTRNSRADWYRRSGSLSRHLRISISSPGESFRLNTLGASGSLLR